MGKGQTFDIFGAPEPLELDAHRSHRFGGTWTAAKLAVLAGYLDTYTKALRHKFALHYFDAFAGDGSYSPAAGGEHPGSVRIALGFQDFASYTFVEQKPSRFRRLQSVLEAQACSDRCRAIKGDGNAQAIEFCRRMNWRGNRALMFLDPYGLSVNWSTLEAVRETRGVDAWYLFPLSAVAREMTLSPGARDADKDAALDRVLGTSSWREDLYRQDPSPRLFGDAPEARRVPITELREWVTDRLSNLFPSAQLAAILHRGSKSDRHGGPQLFALYFLVSNESKAATDLADRLFRGVMHALRRERVVA